MNKHHKDVCLKEIGLCLQMLFTSPHSTVNIIGIQNKQSLLITITELFETEFH